MDPIYRGEGIRLPVTVTAPDGDPSHSYAGAEFTLVFTAVAPEETFTFDVAVDSTATGPPVVVSGHCDLTAAQTEALTSRAYAVTIWCDEGLDPYVCGSDILPVV